MRNPDRLDNFYKDWALLHKKYFPDWRKGQLDFNFYGWLYSNKKVDMFFPEESQMLEYFREYCETMSGGGLNEAK